MDHPAAGSYPSEPTWATRLVGSLALRPGERVLCLGPASGMLASHASSRVGPSGQVVEAGLAGGRRRVLPHPDSGFDAVVVDFATSNHRQKHAAVLSEVTRVTAPTGRVAFALAPAASWDETRMRQLATAGGLRGLAVQRIGTETGDRQAVALATAFPSAPAPDADTASTAALAAQAAQASRPSSRRVRVLAGAGVALVLAIALGLVWGLADAGQSDVQSDSEDELLAGDTDLDRFGAGATESPTDEPATAGEPPTGSGQETGNSASSSGGSSVTSGSGRTLTPDNQPPVIEDLNLSADGLALSVLPIVSDPDGDEVSLDFEVEGAEPRIPPSGDRARATFSYDDVGERHEATVTVTATDTHGASSQQTATLLLVANYGGLVEDLRFTVLTRECFGADEAPQQLMATVQFDGPPNAIGSQLRVDRSDVVLRDRYRTNPSLSPIELEVFVEITFAGATRTHRNVISDDESAMYVFEAPGNCRALVTYDVEFIRF